MRTNWTKMALGALVMITGVISPVISYAQQTQDVRVELNLQDAPMKTAIEVLMRQTGISIVFESTDTPFPAVSLNLADVTAEQALSYICRAAGVFFKKDENGVYIITRNKPSEAAVAAPAPNVPVKRKLYKIKLMRADAQEVLKQITAQYSFDPTEGFKDLYRFQNMTSMNNARIMGGGANTILDGANGIRTFNPSATGVPAVKDNVELMPAGNNGISLPGEAAPQGALGGGGQFGGGGNLGGGGGQIGGGQGGAQGGNLSAGGLIDSTIDYISFDPNDNSIVIRATEQQWRELQGFIDQFDIAPRQVTIKVQFITTTSSAARSLGFDWLYTRGTAVVGNAPGSFARSSDPIFLSYATGNIQTRLRTFIQDGFGTVVATPSVRTLNNQVASVSQGTTTTIFIPQNFITNGTQFTQYQPLQLTAASNLLVRPRINNDETVTVFLTPAIQQFGQLRRSPDGQTIPDISFQQLNIVARVRSGETIVLAGFTNKSDIGSESRFPILGDLPIIGQLFRSRITDKNVSELLVFVTPIIEEDETSLGQ